MHSLCCLLWSALLVLPSVRAQAAGTGNNYTVWASVVFNRIGERTPKILGNLPAVLTSTGAQQMYSAGQFFRNRYFLPGGSASINGMSGSIINTDQLYAIAFDEHASIASAQAFLQGLYPPTTPNTTSTSVLDPTSIYNGSYIEPPLNGYQYPQIHVADVFDPEHVYLSGTYDCPAFVNAARAVANTDQYRAAADVARPLYQTLRPLLSNVLITPGLDFANAYAIYDHVSYQAAHNSSFAASLSQLINGTDTNSFLASLRYLADQEQQLERMNLTAYNVVSNAQTLPLSVKGSISTIGGNFLAAKILAHLQMSVSSRGRYFKLNTFFADFESLMSLFALMNLPNTSTDFNGLPEFASSIVFELYSWDNATGNGYPSPENMYVGFYMRNGSDSGSQLVSYRPFERGPSQVYISWPEFNTQMYNIMLDDVGTWCTQCGSSNLYCAAFNSTLSTYINPGTLAFNPFGGGRGSGAPLSAAAAGAIGAIVALAVAALILGLVMLFGGVRFHRRKGRKASDLGGFKGSAKMASDRDLVLPPNSGAVVDDGQRPLGHERSGSWEMQGQEKKNTSPTAMPAHQERQRAREEEEDDLQVNPFANPVQARESV